MYEIKKGALDPPLEAWLSDRNGPINLTGATVTVSIKQVDGSKLITGAMTVLDVVAAHVVRTWVLGETDTVGLYRMEFAVLWPTIGPRVVPNTGFEDFRVLARAA